MSKLGKKKSSRDGQKKQIAQQLAALERRNAAQKKKK